MAREYDNFEAFFPFYLREHANPRTRYLHYVGTALVLVCLGVAILRADARWILAMPVAGYFFAWMAHAFVERNKPATFTYPLWSLVADFRMFFLAVSGRLGAHLIEAGVPHGADPLER